MLWSLKGRNDWDGRFADCFVAMQQSCLIFAAFVERVKAHVISALFLIQNVLCYCLSHAVSSQIWISKVAVHWVAIAASYDSIYKACSLRIDSL